MLYALLLAQAEETDSGNALIKVVPGLMIWTIVTFLIVLLVLRRFAFGPIQRLIDQRRDRIREALDEADKAREEARQLRELTQKEREAAGAERASLLDETRRQAADQARRAREEADADLQRRLEENRKAIEAENRRFREEIRRDVVELTLLASEKVTRKSLDKKDQKRLIDEAIAELDVERIVSDN
jgi:F-type H+-transporting ATPase subunit b